MFYQSQLPQEEPGIFHAYWTLDGAKIGEHLIEVKPRPDYTVKR